MYKHETYMYMYMHSYMCIICIALEPRSSPLTQFIHAHSLWLLGMDTI